jgi:hypothetical protein
MYQEINFTPTFKKLRDAFILYNEKLKLDKPKEYRKLSLKSTHMETAREIIRFYAAYLHKNSKYQLDEDRRFWITNTGIAKHKLQNRSTIYRHILVLKDAGIITNKIFHGSNCGVEVAINKDLLVYKKNIEQAREWIQQEIFNLESKKTSDNIEAKNIVAKCLDNDSGYFLDTNNINITCEYVYKDKTQETFPKKQGSRVLDLIATNDSITKEDDKKLETRVAGENPKFDSQINTLTSHAWHFAKSILYPKQSFTSEQQTLSLFYIRDYFSLIKEAHFTKPIVERLFEDFCQRILLAKKYIDKTPERFIPVPWTWFNKNFTNGFCGTLSWLKKVKEKRKTLKNYYSSLSELSEHYRDYMLNPSISNYKRIEKELLKKNDESLLKLYYGCVADKNNFNSTYLQNYYKQI